jgi:hypothetical protein
MFFCLKQEKPTEAGFSILAGDGGLFGLRPHPFGASVAALHCSASLTLSASNPVEILILHLEFFLPKKEKPTEVGFSMLAGDGGFEPPHTESESAVLPLDESPID